MPEIEQPIAVGEVEESCSDSVETRFCVSRGEISADGVKWWLFRCFSADSIRHSLFLGEILLRTRSHREEVRSRTQLSQHRQLVIPSPGCSRLRIGLSQPYL